MAPQAADDFHAFGDGGAEVFGAGDRVALIDVVRLDPHLHQVVDETPHDVGVVVHALEQDRLRAQRDASVRQQAARLLRFVAAFVGVQEVQAHPERVVLAQHARELGRDALRQNGRDLCAEADDLNVRDGAEVRKDEFDPVVAQGQRVAAGDQHVADLRLAPDVVEDHLEAARAGGDRAMADHAGTRAVAAVGRTEVGRQQQHPVGIAVDQSGNRALMLFAERVVRFARATPHLVHRRDHRAADGLVRIRGRDETHVVRSDRHGKHVARQFQRFLLFRREADHLPDGRKIPDPVLDLPPPVGPLQIGRAGEEQVAERAALGTHLQGAVMSRLLWECRQSRFAHRGGR